MPSLIFKGEADGTTSVALDQGDGPEAVPQDQADGLIRQYMTVSNVRDAGLTVGPKAKILWRGARHVWGQTNSSDQMVISCEICLEQEVLSLPLTVGQFHDRLRLFGPKHQGCGENLSG